MNHVLTNPKDYYHNFINDNITSGWKDVLNYFFSRSDAKEYLRENDFDSLYNCFYDVVENGVQSDLTIVLLAADIDFLAYMEFIPPGCFDGIEKIDKIIIPKNIERIYEVSFHNLLPGVEVSYEGTVSELNKLIDVSKYIFKKEFVSKVICSDGEVEIK